MNKNKTGTTDICSEEQDWEPVDGYETEQGPDGPDSSTVNGPGTDDASQRYLSPLRAIRAQCLICMGGNDGFIDNYGKWVPPHKPYGAVRDCPNQGTCPLWLFRLGTYPARRKKPGSEPCMN
jgi:hypothetical protein